jgi:heat shock protein HslJ
MGAAARVLVLLVLGLAVSACGGSEVPSLDGTSWTLVSLAGQEPLAEAPITIEFAGEQVSGSSGCNRYSGGYTVDGNELSIGPLATTRMACPDQIMAQEATYLAELEGSVSYAVEDGRLAIETAGGTLTYAAA